MTPPPSRADTLDMHAADVATFRSEIAHLQKQFDAHAKDDKDMQVVFFREINTLKRLVWIQIGGIASLAWIVGIIGYDILKYLR